MSGNQKTPERREELRKKDLKRNPTGNLNDAFNRAGTGNLTDLVDSLGWKGLVVFILIIIIGFIREGNTQIVVKWIEAM